MSSSFLKAQRQAQSSFRLIGLAVAGFSIGAAARGIAGFIDASKQLEAQLRLATRETGSFAQAQEDVRRIATETRAGLEETANLYAAFQRNSRELRITQEQSARATQTVSESFQISGSTAEEAAGGLRQFLQALQSGQLRGEEFNSVMENAPRLARLLADSLGVTIGQLRAMAAQGRITADKLIAALTDRRFTDQIDDEFRQLPVTFDQAVTQMRNSAIEFFGGFDRGGQFSQAIIAFAGGAQGSFEDISLAGIETGRAIRNIFEGLGNIFNPMGDNAHNVFEFIRNEAQGLESAIQEILGGIDQFTGVLNARLDLRSGRIETSHGTHFQRTYNQGSEGSAFDFIARAQGMAAQLRAQGSGGAPLPAFTPTGTGGGRSRGGGAARAERERERALRDEAEFYSELRRFRSDILRAQQEQTTDAVTRADLENQVLDVEREQYAADLGLRVTLGDLTEAKAQQLQAAYDAADTERRGAIALDRQRQINDENRDIAQSRFEVAADALRQESDLADTANARRAVELRLLELTYRTERARLQAVIADEASSRTAVAEAEARLAALNTWRANEARLVALRTQGPLESFLDRLPTTAERANEALQRIAAEGLQSVEDGLLAALTGTKSLADAFRDMVGSIIADLLRLQIQRMITIPLANAISGLSMFGGGSGAATAAGFGKFFTQALGAGGVPGFAEGGSMVLGGRSGVDRNFLSLNGLPIARVSRGEELNIGRRGGSSLHIGSIQVVAPNTGDPRRDRRTAMQQAALIRDEIAKANRGGY